MYHRPRIPSRKGVNFVPETEPQLSVLIVSYNSAHLLAECIEPLRAVAGREVEIVVVDNASFDDPRSALEATGIPHVFRESGSNGGFAFAVNIAASIASGPYLALLNPDVTFGPDVIPHLLRRMDDDPGIAAIAPLLLTDGVQTANGGRLPTATAMFAHASGLARALGAKKAAIGHYSYAKPSSGDVAVEWLSGGFLVIRRSATAPDRLLSERWFMYAEDIDLSVYLARSGRLVLDTDVSAYHAIGGSSGGDEKPRTMWVAAIQDFHNEVLSRTALAGIAWNVAFALGFAARALVFLAKRDSRRARVMSAYARAGLASRPEDIARIDRSISPLSAR